MRIPRRTALRFATPIRSFTSFIPTIPSEPHTIFSKHGYTWKDEFSWIKGANTNKLRELVQNEATYFRRISSLLQLDALSSQLRDETTSMLPNHAESPPERIGAFEYYVRQTSNKPLMHYLHRRWHSDGDVSTSESTVLDMNELAKVHGDEIHVEDVCRLVICQCS